MHINEAVLVQVVVGYWDAFSFGTLADLLLFHNGCKLKVKCNGNSVTPMNVDTKSGKPINVRERERNQRENLKDGSKLGMVRRTRSGLPQHASKIKSKPYKTLMTRTIGSDLNSGASSFF